MRACYLVRDGKRTHTSAIRNDITRFSVDDSNLLRGETAGNEQAAGCVT